MKKFTKTSNSRGDWNFGTFSFPKSYYPKKSTTAAKGSFTIITAAAEKSVKMDQSVDDVCEPEEDDDDDDSLMDLSEDPTYLIDLSNNAFKWVVPECVQDTLNSMQSNSNDSAYYTDEYDFEESSVDVYEIKNLTEKKTLVKCLNEVMISSCDYVLEEGELMKMLLESTRVFIYKGDSFMSYGSVDFPTTYKDYVILGFGLLKEIKKKNSDQITLLVSKKGFEHCSEKILSEIMYQTKKGRILYAFTDFSIKDQKPFLNLGFKGDVLDERGARNLLEKCDVEVPRIKNVICPVFSITI